MKFQNFGQDPLHLRPAINLALPDTQDPPQDLTTVTSLSHDPKGISLPLYDKKNQNVAIWKQEHITLATNLLASLNETEFITKSINRLSVNVPNGVKKVQNT